jgi:cobalt-zinc-cadmium efflux system protein
MPQSAARTRSAHIAHADGRRLTIVFAVTLCYFVAEVAAGLLTNSLALLSDAAHMLSDAAALALALFAFRFSSRPITPEKTYGYYRAEILAALANGAALFLLSAGIAYQAYLRILQPPQVLSGPVLAVAVVGLAVNAAGALILSRGRRDSLNIRGAFLHVVGDALGSVAVIIGALVMLTTGRMIADPVVSLGIALLIIYSAWALVRESVDILMEGCPAHLDVRGLEQAMLSVPGVQQVTDIHVWTLTSGVHLMTAHAVISGWNEGPAIRARLRQLLWERFGIEHSTIELATPDQAAGPLH